MTLSTHKKYTCIKLKIVQNDECADTCTIPKKRTMAHIAYPASVLITFYASFHCSFNKNLYMCMINMI